jgi:hypothetical protein
MKKRDDPTKNKTYDIFIRKHDLEIVHYNAHSLSSLLFEKTLHRLNVVHALLVDGCHGRRTPSPLQ